MSKIAIVFSGQGAQTVGMAEDIVKNYKESKEVFEIASNTLGYNMEELCFKGPEETLKITENTQPAILCASYAMLLPLIANGVKAEMTAGLSLGEYTANVYAETIPFEKALNAVKMRGRFMQEEVAEGIGGMSAILGLENDIVEKLCKDSESFGYVACANYNAPGQVVISGELKALENVGKLAIANGARRVVPLKVSAPFHCDLLKGAGEKLSVELGEINFNNPIIPIIANVTGLPYKSSSDIKELLVKQVSNTVKWRNSINYMIETGIDTFIEVGPGKTLSGLIKKIDRSKTIFNVSDMDSLENTLKGVC